MSDELMIYFDKDGKAREYDDNYDITIHCESMNEHVELLDKLRRFWQCDSCKTLCVNVLDNIKSDLWMEGINMTDEYQGVWVRYRDIERIIDKYKASRTRAESEDKI